MALKAKAIAMLKASRPQLGDLSDCQFGLCDDFDRVFVAESREWESVIMPVEPFTMNERLAKNI
jgi:hypothetical protein